MTKRTTRRPDDFQYFQEDVWDEGGSEGEDLPSAGDEEVISEEDAAEKEREDGYVLDASPVEDSDMPKPIGEIRYFGASSPEGIKIFEEENGGGEEVEALPPGDVVAAEVPEDGTWGRLLDGRGWIHLDMSNGVEEIHPWAAKQMTKRITREDANSLAYLTMDEEKAPLLSQHLPLPKRVIGKLEKRGITKASPIQEAVFHEIYNGKSICLQSQTGTGKTLAMALPVLTAMSEESEWGYHGDKMIIVTSCPEVAVQIFSEIDSMGWFPQGKGFATMAIMGNMPPDVALLKANVIIGTANELGGMLHKNHTIIKQLNTKLRAVVLDEVDEYTTAHRQFGSKWSLQKKKRQYYEKKRTLDVSYMATEEMQKGFIELFLKRTFAYCRRRDFQVLAASATMNRNMKRKVFRLMRWDPLGRWYNDPPPLIRPKAVMDADWQSSTNVPIISEDVKHTYVRTVRPKEESRGFEIGDKHWARKPYSKGGLAPLRKRGKAAGINRRKYERGFGYPVAKLSAVGMFDGLHDALKSRGNGSVMLILTRHSGVTQGETLQKLQEWGFYEAEVVNHAMFTMPTAYHERQAMMYNLDMRDHANDIFKRHADLQDRVRSGEPAEQPVGSYAWRMMSARKEYGESTSPILIAHETVSRGIHFDGLKSVYIFGTPRTPQAYMHIAGRVGRLGQGGGPGKVVSIVGSGGPKQLKTWAPYIGPKVKFEPEPIKRIRSIDVDKFSAPSWLRPLRQLRRPTMPLDDEEEEEVTRTEEPMLLPEPGDIMRMPSFDDEAFAPEPEPVVRDRVAEAVHAETRGSQSSRLKRVMASQMQRARGKWPGPPKVPKYVTRKEKWMMDPEKGKWKRSIDDPSKPA
eukprot:CAMPEP_0197680034 /NCGR_PEP_ID=MMETSP1338-20131121/92635_1 /TAXON_ID=43686 ORGANISM="Pelagodinium beii, Strain RCC1491" /NCGR_SAMPLE_ID=MMETSP1338 /ASSEMBLY_ACC=CAM_ASM_000754 /LENGTH=855 /DNA_ID=CAMNT_0043261161 /DNA_START=165 /DNA_END=2732 /DNA_ORIENTATION=-